MDTLPSQPVAETGTSWKGFLVVLAIVTVVLIGSCLFRVRLRDVLVSDSPDGAHRMIVRERARHIDRNFHVVLVDLVTGNERVIFTSEDQSPTNSHERFVWSGNSSKVALVGDRYYVIPEATLENGEIVFLMYDLESETLKCNSEYERGYQRIPAQLAIEVFGRDSLLKGNPF